MKVLKKFLPDEHVQSVFEIRPSELKERGIKGIITDLDNTLVAWDQADATPEIVQWFKLMKENDIQVTVVSNNNESRVTFFSEPLNIPFIHSARKPLGKAFRKARKEMNLNKEEIVVVGDQLLTDVLGGNRADYHTVLVVPIVQTDGLWTRVNRKIERQILGWMKSRGMLNWEDKEWKK
ncbi:YqeG family HAD IIIA-type phosphatase [Pontibacillus sp. ALD_SL1]|uniref:YqeG family HAD IIIA-type phosphatase n=1 Tax=Pontibacillus sp. ALD_SL1 TaxID=2777185 RepID=UPI003530176D